MPELRWTLLIIGVLFVGILAWWERRRPHQASRQAPHIGEDPRPVGSRNEAGEREQIERVRALRARRDPLRWRAALDRVQEQANSSVNLMPAILEAVESYATVGEIAGSLRKIFGEHLAT